MQTTGKMKAAAGMPSEPLSPSNSLPPERATSWMKWDVPQSLCGEGRQSTGRACFPMKGPFLVCHWGFANKSVVNMNPYHRSKLGPKCPHIHSITGLLGIIWEIQTLTDMNMLSLLGRIRQSRREVKIDVQIQTVGLEESRGDGSKVLACVRLRELRFSPFPNSQLWKPMPRSKPTKADRVTCTIS